MGITVRAPGTCGELVQGTIGGRNFLITCPINVYSEVRLGSVQNQTSVGEKTRMAIEKTLAYLRQPVTGLDLAVRSDLPVGKGMASSSADIGAACQAVAHYIGRVLTPDEIADIALAIEPTDGIFYPGIVMFDHVSGSIRQLLGAPPLLHIAVFDVGGEVNTQYFNQRNDLAALNAAKEPQVLQAAEWVAEGLRRGDSQLIGRGATLSAVANQTILYKPCLETVIELAGRHGAVGVNAAHSGTVLGILFAAGQYANIAPCIAAIEAACPGIAYWRTVELIGGGLVIGKG